MNTYTTKFHSECPANGCWIEYTLKISTGEVIRVEKILDEVQQMRIGFHEDFADALLLKFGGSQTLTAHHHGVTIETIRPHLCRLEKGCKE